MELTIVLCLILLLNYAFSLVHIKNYKKNMDEIVSGYKGKEGYYLFSGMERGRFRAGAIAILVVDQDYVIHECHVLKGRTNILKFKPVHKFKEKQVGEMLSDINEQYKYPDKAKIQADDKALMKAGENALLSIAKKRISVAI